MVQQCKTVIYFVRGSANLVLCITLYLYPITCVSALTILIRTQPLPVLSLFRAKDFQKFRYCTVLAIFTDVSTTIYIFESAVEVFEPIVGAALTGSKVICGQQECSTLH